MIWLISLQMSRKLQFMQIYIRYTTKRHTLNYNNSNSISILDIISEPG